MIDSFRSEWILLNRTAPVDHHRHHDRRLHRRRHGARDLDGEAVPASGPDAGLALEALLGAGGATAAVIFSIGFSSILVLAAFASSTGNEFTRGTLRVALTAAAAPVVVDGRQARRPPRRRVDPDGLALRRRRGHRGRSAAPTQDIDTTRLVRRRRPRRKPPATTSACSASSCSTP